ncbi:MAG: hypothetical protein KH452_08215 [Clostridiales bacterium]|nr:hypothetical protein [Clostridiales bacterium]
MAENRIFYLAGEALKCTRCSLRQKLPLLDGAFALPEQAWTKGQAGTDGETVYWDPQEVLRLFVKEPVRLQRQYLHLMFHGLYLHMFRKNSCQERIWWIACDLLTEYRIDRMDATGFERPVPPGRSRCYRRIREAEVPFEERALVKWLSGQDTSGLEELEALFRVDDHLCWREKNSIWAEGQHLEAGQLCPEEIQSAEAMVHRWRSVFEQLKERSEEHRRQAGGSAGEVCQPVTLERERAYDYRQFLRRFAVTGEELCLDMDSFDYIPYDYSQRMYEDLVFLEPLEYKEMQKLQELVIAIDTSGSCSGEIVRQFLEETWEIFSEKDQFFRDMSIHVIQCDCLIQEHVCITCEEQWKEYLDHIIVKGHGDTDFTPVFRLVDEMIRSREIRHLRGLLYFTDGDGIYPSQKPEYETAFVFLNESMKKGAVPDWALALTLDRE